MNLEEVEREIYCLIIQVKKQSAGDPVRVIVILRSAFAEELSSAARHDIVGSFVDGAHDEFELFYSPFSAKLARGWFKDVPMEDWEFVEKPDRFKSLEREMKKSGWIWKEYLLDDMKRPHASAVEFNQALFGSQNQIETTIENPAPYRAFDDPAYVRSYARQEDSILAVIFTTLLISSVVLVFIVLYCVLVWPVQAIHFLFKKLFKKADR